MKSSEAMIVAVMNGIFFNCVEKPEEFRTSTGFEISVRRYNQLSYGATDVGNWSFVASNVPVRNKSMINE